MRPTVGASYEREWHLLYRCQPLRAVLDIVVGPIDESYASSSDYRYDYNFADNDEDHSRLIMSADVHIKMIAEELSRKSFVPFGTIVGLKRHDQQHS
jgi:hypothetical protein